MHLLLILNLFLNCLQVNAEKALSKKLQGVWVWYKTTSTDFNAGGKTMLPTDCSCSKRLEFTKDHKLKVFENDSLIGESLYQLDSVKFLKDPIRYMLNSKALSNDIALDSNHLIVGMRGVCGSVEYYKRKKVK